jgi:hypothetical protein
MLASVQYVPGSSGGTYRFRIPVEMGLASRIASHAIGWAAIEGNIVRPKKNGHPDHKAGVPV